MVDHRKFIDKADVDIFGPKSATKQHFRDPRVRFNGYMMYLRERERESEFLWRNYATFVIDEMQT